MCTKMLRRPLAPLIKVSFGILAIMAYGGAFQLFLCSLLCCIGGSLSLASSDSDRQWPGPADMPESRRVGEGRTGVQATAKEEGRLWVVEYLGSK